MRKVVLCTAVAVVGLSLYSFRGVEQTEKFNNIQLEELEFGDRAFIRDYKLQPNKFIQYREIITIDKFKEADKMQYSLNKF